jgi:hypothetical protein
MAERSWRLKQNQANRATKREAGRGDTIASRGEEMDPDAKKNQIVRQRLDSEPAEEPEIGMDAKRIRPMIKRMNKEKGEFPRVYDLVSGCGRRLLKTYYWASV